MIAFSCCHQGASHIRTGKVCQDAAYARFREDDRYAAITSVATGVHGLP